VRGDLGVDENCRAMSARLDSMDLHWPT
jgi:hypothetical protein